MENGGNAKVNAIFEARLNREKPTNHADLQTRERYIRDKYERRKFYDPSAFGTYRAAPSRAPAPASQQPQEIALPALRTGPAGPPSDVAQRRIEERRRRNKGLSPKEGDKPLRRVGSSDSAKEGKSKKSSRKGKSQGSSAGNLSQSSSVDLLDFGSDPAPAPAPSSNANTDLFGFIEPSQTATRTPSETFGSSFFKDANAGDNKKKSTAAADIMALYGGGSSNQGAGNANGYGQQPQQQQNFYNGGAPNSMNAMTNQMGQMNLNGRQQQQQQWTPQQQQQMMMMQQQQMMMMMQQQQQQGQANGNYGNFNPQMMNGGFNPQMMNNNMMMAGNNGYGGQMAAMGGNAGGRAPQKEDPFASLGGRNTFR